MKNLIFAIGPAWNNLNVLLKTIKTNKTILPNITKIYIPTNVVRKQPTEVFLKIGVLRGYAGWEIEVFL